MTDKRLAVCHIVSFAFLFLLTTSGFSQDYRPYSESQARFIAEHDAFHPQNGVRVALDIKPNPGWHTYWRNPGDSGAAPILEYAVTPGTLQVRPVKFSVPNRFDVGPLTSFGYEDRVLFISSIVPSERLEEASSVTITLNAEWLVCKVECIPAFASWELTLPVSQAPAESDHAGSFATFSKQHPTTLPDAVSVSASTKPLALSISSPGVSTKDFFPDIDSGLSFSRPHREENGSVTTLLLAQSDSSQTPITSIQGLLVLESDGETIGSHIDIPLSSSPQHSLLVMLVFAFLGGLILNLMPCVLPVIGIKMLSLTQHTQASSRRRKLLVASYVLGILASFLILASILLMLQWGGASLGWGFQLQNPSFVMAMVLLFFLIGANLLGWLPINWIPQVGAASVPAQNSLKHEFLTGVLAVIVATPCTAPFMGAAIGAALSLGPVACLLVFSCLGLGLAFPYALLLVTHRIIKWLPRPGMWMEVLRQGMAFPMFATVIWLMWVLSQQIGASAWLFGSIAVLLIGFALWLRQRRKRAGSLAAAVVSIAAIALPASMEINNSLHDSTVSDTQWQPFVPEKVEELRQIQPVFINFTAAWCITCQVNKRVTFSSTAVQEFLNEHNIATIEADWTNRDPIITQYLRRFQRAGVPMYLFYSPDKETPVLLPEVLTPSIFMDAIKPHLVSNE